jgi:hypothetical protein
MGIPMTKNNGGYEQLPLAAERCTCAHVDTEVEGGAETSVKWLNHQTVLCPLAGVRRYEQITQRVAYTKGKYRLITRVTQCWESAVPKVLQGIRF